MPGIELVVGYLFAWLMRRASDRVDAEADQALDAGAERVRELVSGQLGDDPALARLEEEAETGQEEPSPRTRQRLHLALEDAADRDPVFAEALRQIIEELVELRTRAGTGGPSIGGSVTIQADHGSAAAWTMGDVTLGNPPQPGPHPNSQA